MALTRSVDIEKVEILQNGNIQVAVAIQISDDDEEESKRYLRFVLKPGSDVDAIIAEQPERHRPPAAQIAKLKRVAAVVWS